MASRPKAQRIRRFLSKIAQAGLGANATPLDWAVAETAAGKSMCALAEDVARLSGESCSNSWLGRLLYAMAPDAHTRIAQARRDGWVILPGWRPPIDRDAVEREAAQWRATHTARTAALWKGRTVRFDDLQRRLDRMGQQTSFK